MRDQKTLKMRCDIFQMISMGIEEEVKELSDEITRIRRDFHKYPELGFQEYRTSGKIKSYLEDIGLDVKSGLAKTGVAGLLRGSKPGPTLLLRSDMDALPIKEENDVPYKSVNDGVMHACGHDAHMAMLLVAAKILYRYKNKIKGSIKFVFQPNEEDAGAEFMVRDGVLEKPKVDAALGLHVWSSIKTGMIGVVDGPFMASSYYFKMVISGKGGHGGAPHTSIDPIVCAANIIQSVQSIQTREIDALHPTVITFGKINCGTYNIIIPEKIELEGSIRCLHDNDEFVRKRFEEKIANICSAYKTTYELDFKCGNRLLSNDFGMVKLVKSVARSLVTVENIIGSNSKTMIGEDFAEYALRVPSAFYFVGTGNPDKGTDYPHHNAHFNIDEDSLPLGVEMHVRTALEFFNEK